MRIFNTIQYSLRFAIGSTLFGLFYHFATGNAQCSIPNGSPTIAYVGFAIITLVLFLELGYIIVRTRAFDTNRSEVSTFARAALFLFDSTYVLLASITAFAALYKICPVINIECTSGQDALYFSMVTFTTLGYGDLTPNDQFKILAAGQAVLGYITFGLIVGYAGSLFGTSSRTKGIH